MGDAWENNKKKSSHNDGNASTPSSNSNSNQTNDDPILPAFYAPSSIFPTSVTNKIDLSSSVSQYLRKETITKENDKKTDSYVAKEDGNASDTNTDNDSVGSRSPPTKSSSSNNFEFFSRQIPETSHPAPQALDEKSAMEYDSSGKVLKIFFF